MSASFALAAFFQGTHFACTVHFDHARFQQQIYFAGTRFGGKVSFREASFTTLSFEDEGGAAVFDPGVPVDLTGCAYNFIEIADWRDLMKRLDPPAPQPWGQLIRALRAAGKEEEARDAYFEWRLSEGARLAFRKQAARSLLDRFEHYVAGYGVRFRFVFGWIAAFLLLGWFVFTWPGALRSAKDYRAELSAEVAGPFYLRLDHTAAMSFRVFMPVEVYVGRRWEPRPGWPSAYAALHTLAGWILIPVVVASLTGLLRREPPT